MTNYLRRSKLQDYDINPRWWLVPLALVLLLTLAAWLAAPSLDDRVLSRQAAAPLAGTEFSTGAPDATTHHGLTHTPVAPVRATPLAERNEPSTEEDNHAATF